jgi:hypothetical protein
MEFAIINLGISLYYLVMAVVCRIPPYASIPGGIAAIGFYAAAEITGLQ